MEHAMPQVIIPVVVGLLVEAGIAAAVATVVGTIAVYGALIGGAYLLSRPRAAGTQQQPKPEAVQQTIRQAIAPRIRHYGRVKVGGILTFYESLNGVLHSLIVTGHGEIDSIEQYWLNDKQVTLNANGEVQEAAYRLNGAASGGGGISFLSSVPLGNSTGSTLITLKPKLGTALQTAHAGLTSTFPTLWTAAHRQQGCSNIYCTFRETPAESFSKYYSGGAPNVTIVLKGAKLFDPRTNVTVWSDNSALIILDFLTHADGYRLPIAEINLACFAEQAAICDELVPLKAGGTEKRYRAWGSYSLQESPRDVLSRMLDTCDGEIYADNNGKISLRVGKWVEPTVTISDETGEILAFNMTGGNNALSAFNVVKHTFTSEKHGFQTQEGDPWRDNANIALRAQELETSRDLTMVPSFAQARRLAKIASIKGNPAFTGSFQANLAGLKALNQRVIKLTVSEAGIYNTPILISGVRISEGLGGVDIQYVTLPSDMYEWNAALEEGNPPLIATAYTNDSVVEPPTGVLVAVETISPSVGGTAPVLRVSWDMPSRDSLSHRVRYKLTSETVWNEAVAVAGVLSLQTGIVNDGAEYEVQAASMSPLGQVSAWSPDPAALITILVNPTPPPSVTAVSATGGVGVVNWAWTNPNAANFNHVKLMVNTTNTLTGAVQQGLIYGSANQSQTAIASGVAAGTYYGWVVSVSSSNIAGGAIATGSISVT
jgi:hypothetical protein